jgi:hypothetical protein
MASALPLIRASRHLWRDRRAAAATELALLLPFCLLLILGLVDLVNYVFVVDKIDRVAAASADLVARFSTLHEADIDSVLAAATELANPVPLTRNGGVIITAVSRGNGASAPSVVAWQRLAPQSLIAQSRIGRPGGAPTLPPGFALAPGETAIFAETFYPYQPWVFAGGLLGQSSVLQLYDMAVYRPRLGTLAQILD